MATSSPSHQQQQTSSLLRGTSPSRAGSGLFLRRNSASSETSSIGTEPRHGSLTERLGRLTRRRSSHSGPHPHSLRRHKSGVPADELLLASTSDGHGGHAGVAHLTPEEEEAAFEREWGLTVDAEARLLSEFKESILSSLPPGKALPPHTDDYKLRRFLRARQHYLAPAREMWDRHVRWREEFGVDTTLPHFHFHERDAFVSLYPQGYHRVDRLGRPVYIQHVGSIDMRRLLEVTTEERMLKFHVQEYERCANYILPACSLAAGRHIDQTFGVLDVKGVGLRHLTGDVKRMLTRVMSVDQDNFPEMMGHTCVINAPSVFKAIWAFVRPMLDARTQAKVEVCSGKYQQALLKWVAPENLPEYLGGTSTATLLDDSGPWQDPGLLAAVEAAEAAREGRRRGRGGGIEEGDEEGDGAEGVVVEVEGDESLPAPAWAKAPSSTAISAAASTSADGEVAAPPPPSFGARDAAAAAGAAALPLPPPPVSVPARAAAADEEEGDGWETPKSEASFASALSDVASVSSSAAGDGNGSLTAPLAPGSSSTPPPLLERVKKLEASLPRVAAAARERSARVGGSAGARLSEAASAATVALGDGRGTLLMRVQALEAAAEALLDAEVAAAKGSDGKVKVGCCSVM